MRIHVTVDELADHSLILSVMFSCLGLEEINALFAQRQCNLDFFFAEFKLLGRRKKILKVELGSDSHGTTLRNLRSG